MGLHPRQFCCQYLTPLLLGGGVPLSISNKGNKSLTVIVMDLEINRHGNGVKFEANLSEEVSNTFGCRSWREEAS